MGNMLFNSYVFLFAFLPTALLGFRIFSIYRLKTLAIYWLIGMSTIFYMYWNPPFVCLLLLSVVINFYIGKKVSAAGNHRKLIFILGIVFNLCLLGYFKYFNFFLDNLSYYLGFSWVNLDIFLPLGISFWTFQQISYLVDIYKKRSDSEEKFFYYAAYIFFFPHLIAGPIVHHSILIKQLKQDKIFRLSYKNITLGLCFLSVGLFKKVVIADQLSPWVKVAFENGMTLTSSEAWIGALAYTLQIYFDFSGYSDMAMGLAYFFNIKFPVNFYSPYKSTSIIEFWRRWHMTLSFFLRDYLYIPLGGKYAKYRNILLTMLIGGLWHGANWTFVSWGGAFGVLICINHFWRAFSQRIQWNLSKNIAWVMSFLLIVHCWVLFRANTMEQALQVFTAMYQVPDISLFVVYKMRIIAIVILIFICKLSPESWEFIEFKGRRKYYKITVCFIMMIISILMMNTTPSEFLYFQF